MKKAKKEKEQKQNLRELWNSKNKDKSERRNQRDKKERRAAAGYGGDFLDDEFWENCRENNHCCPGYLCPDCAEIQAELTW